MQYLYVNDGDETTMTKSLVSINDLIQEEWNKQLTHISFQPQQQHSKTLILQQSCSVDPLCSVYNIKQHFFDDHSFVTYKSRVSGHCVLMKLKPKSQIIIVMDKPLL